MTMSEITAEFGSSFPVEYVDLRACDTQGNRIHIPTCDKCGGSNMGLYSNEDDDDWICSFCGNSKVTFHI